MSASLKSLKQGGRDQPFDQDKSEIKWNCASCFAAKLGGSISHQELHILRAAVRIIDRNCRGVCVSVSLGSDATLLARAGMV